MPAEAAGAVSDLRETPTTARAAVSGLLRSALALLCCLRP